MSTQHVFEIRTYRVNPGKLDALLTRFRTVSLPLFARHGLKGIAYWTTREGDEDLLIYVMSHPSRADAAARWATFQADPEWQRAKKASETEGALVRSIQSTIGDATDFSPVL